MRLLDSEISVQFSPTTINDFRIRRAYYSFVISMPAPMPIACPVGWRASLMRCILKSRFNHDPVMKNLSSALTASSSAKCQYQKTSGQPIRTILQTLCLAAFATAMVLMPFARPSETAKQPDLRQFMIQKRAYSQIVLDGLMSEDYSTIILAGENMRKMRADKRWDRLASADYNRYSEDFEKAAQNIVDSARRRNLDECMNSYLKCLQSCYNCHKYVRSLPVPTSFERIHE